MYLKDKGITLFAIGVGKKIGDYELYNIATNGSYVFYAKNYQQLLNDTSILHKVAERFNNCEGTTDSCERNFKVSVGSIVVQQDLGKH